MGEDKNIHAFILLIYPEKLSATIIRVYPADILKALFISLFLGFLLSIGKQGNDVVFQG